ncbi:hypothetical protein GCM10008955_09510 [Deinococcus malanensis]|uniref:histidine kinase n=1 Tax=Deinococcus malanensis TaxID=1706855 RepID=A0ABQ2ER47_9DEIO|nr:ATP-binding protein [Deinococcus malanensis]GGK18187.1 hypothetical protein GCM10008955_09510 [Deinococcus malanensis]
MMLPPSLNGTIEDQSNRLAALEAFVEFTEAVGTQSDVSVLAHQAIRVLRARFPDGSVVYYEPDGDLWRPRVWSEDLPAGVLSGLTPGLPRSLPAFAAVLSRQEAVFIDELDAVREQLAGSEEYGMAAKVPLMVSGEVCGILEVGIRGRDRWGEQDQGLVRAVSRSLTLALERASVTAQLEAQNAELAARTRALGAFAELTRDLNVHSDSLALVRTAQEVVLSMLPPGYAVYYELGGATWRLAAQTGDLRNPALQAVVDAGLPYEQPRNLVVPWTTGRPFYQDHYDTHTDRLYELVSHVNTTASLAVQVNDAPAGVFCVALFDRRCWTDIDKVMLETVVGALGLAIEGSHGVAQLTEQRRKLTEANEELEAFAYSVSHDLRAPVRHILSFNQLAQVTLGDRMDDRSARYLRHVEQAADRMNTLIDAILALSRTSRQPLRMVPVDLNALMTAVCAELSAVDSGRKVEWKIARLPMACGDPETLRLVLTNLASNALKYTRTRETPQIEVWSEDRSVEWAIMIRDNGVGFDPRYSNKLFGVFQRLHQQHEFEGTGVGLANVRRIVSRHGGRVWAEGAVGQGATFGFTLPKEPQAAGA